MAGVQDLHWNTPQDTGRLLVNMFYAYLGQNNSPGENKRETLFLIRLSELHIVVAEILKMALVLKE